MGNNKISGEKLREAMKTKKVVTKQQKIKNQLKPIVDRYKINFHDNSFSSVEDFMFALMYNEVEEIINLKSTISVITKKVKISFFKTFNCVNLRIF